MSDVTNELSIKSYLHCGKCLDEMPDGLAPKEWSDVQAGWTDKGLQVWCNRHDCNVVNIDFEGNKHPADTTAKSEKHLHSVK